MPWFWSDQYDNKLQMVGVSGPADSTVVLGDPESRSFTVTRFEGEVLVEVDAVNRPRDFVLARRLVAQRATRSGGFPADAEVLTDLFPQPARR